jgi:SEC-C motif-containing protein
VHLMRCPCLSGETYDQCCGEFHRSTASPATAEQLMRSRYSAFAVRDHAYLLASWHPSTRPTLLELDPDIRWYRLDILRTSQGGRGDTEGSVEFRAYFRSDGGAGDHYENSRFVRIGGLWVYLGELRR